MIAFNTKEPDISVPADEKTLMFAFDLSPMEAKFLQAMLGTTEWIGKEELPEVSYSIRQVIYTLRNKLGKLKIWVINDGNGRYSIPPACKEIVRHTIEASLPKAS